jgi:hypothetical protein
MRDLSATLKMTNAGTAFVPCGDEVRVFEMAKLGKRII